MMLLKPLGLLLAALAVAAAAPPPPQLARRIRVCTGDRAPISMCTGLEPADYTGVSAAGGPA